jgi:hypothetical protein
MPSQIDKKRTKQNIDLILEKMRTDVDPRVLNEYRALFRRSVSLFRRSWVSAYLLMLFDRNAPGRLNGGGARRTGRNSAAEGRRFSLTEEESRRLFVSIGRNRRVFPREILGLINTKTTISRKDIGAIRVLDNYSFVQVRDTVADQIIEALNGCAFRGRTLQVNYAKSRKDGVPLSGAAEDAGDYAPDTEISEQGEYNPDKEDI